MQRFKVDFYKDYDLCMVQTPVLSCEDGGGVDDHPGEQAAALGPHPDLKTD